MGMKTMKYQKPDPNNKNNSLAVRLVNFFKIKKSTLDSKSKEGSKTNEQKTNPIDIPQIEW